MIYIGGIAVMFLFLILIVDVKVENTKNIFFTNNYYFTAVALTVFFSFFVSTSYILFFDPFSFNSIYFQDIIEHNDFLASNSVKFQFDILNYYYICDFDFSDLFILGVYFFKFYSINVLLIGLYLFIATTIAISLSTSVFEINVK